MAAQMVNILNSAGVIHTLSETDYNTHYKGKCVRLAQADLNRLVALDTEVAEFRARSKSALKEDGTPDSDARIAAAASAAASVSTRKKLVDKMLGDIV